MPTLNWIGKEAVAKHHKEVPFRLLEPVPALCCGPADSGNLIVQGDNLHVLKALLPRYSGCRTRSASWQRQPSPWVTWRLATRTCGIASKCRMRASHD